METNKIKGLRVGVVVSNNTTPIVLICTDGTLRLYTHNKDQVNLSTGDILLFQETKDDFVKFAVPISEFEYFTNIRGYNREFYDEELYNTRGGLCVPKNLTTKHSKFIVNNGCGYQFIVYYRDERAFFVDWRYTEPEQDLISLYFESQDTFNFEDVLIDIDRYLDETDFTSIIKSLEIYNDEFYHSRPGKDDYYYINKKRTIFDDKYIDSLFPCVEEQIYEDHGWCSYSSLHVDFVRRDYLKEEQEAINKAIELYDKEAHRRFLITQAYNKYHKEEEDYRRRREEAVNSFVSEYRELLSTQRVNIPFAKSMNELLRSFYKGVHHRDIDGHNFM